MVHIDTDFGDMVLVGGNRYALVFVDRATRHKWVFGLSESGALLLSPVFQTY